DADAPTEPPPICLLSPAAAYDEAAPRRAWASSSGEERDKALARGTLVHRLLQSLPDIPKAARADAARRYLARSAATFSAEERETIVAQLGQIGRASCRERVEVWVGDGAGEGTAVAAGGD